MEKSTLHQEPGAGSAGMDWDDQVGLMEQSRAVLAHAIGSVVVRGEKSGTADGAVWSVDRELGKQQPVYMVDLSFSETGQVLPVVLRPSSRKFHEYYDASAAVRRYYPRLYAAERPEGYRAGGSVYALEKLEGFHGDNAASWDNDQYDAFIADPEHFEQLCQEMFAAVDDIFQEPLEIHDVRPERGHNVIYNTKTGHFQLFDVDTLWPSDKSHAEKFISFIELGQRVDRPVEATYITRMLELYQLKYPEVRDFRLESEMFHRRDYTIVEADQEDDGTLVRPEDETYAQIYRDRIDWMGTRGKPLDQLPILKQIDRVGRNLTVLNPDVLNAIDQGDMRQLADVLNTNQGRLTVTNFIELA